MKQKQLENSETRIFHNFSTIISSSSDEDKGSDKCNNRKGPLRRIRKLEREKFQALEGSEILQAENKRLRAQVHQLKQGIQRVIQNLTDFEAT